MLVVRLDRAKRPITKVGSHKSGRAPFMFSGFLFSGFAFFGFLFSGTATPQTAL